MNRTLLEFLLPFAAIAVTASLIASIGLLLLSIGAETEWNILGLFHMSAPVVVALLIAVAILGGATLLARTGKGGQRHKS